MWAEGAHAHLGMTVPGFPSMFILYGPNTNTSGGSIITYLEAQAGYVRQALEHVRRRGAAAIDVRPEVEAASDREIQGRFPGTAWTRCESWYRDDDRRADRRQLAGLHDASTCERTRELDLAEFGFVPLPDREPLRSRARRRRSHRSTSSGGKRPWSTTPGVADSRAATAAGSREVGADVGDDAAVRARRRAVANDASAAGGRASRQAEGSSSTGTGARARRPAFDSSTITTKRSAAAATIFSRVCAPPPPLTSQRSGATSSAPSIARSRRVRVSNDSTGEAELARLLLGRRAGRDAAQVAQAALGQGGEEEVDGRAGPEPEAHAVLDERRRLGGRRPLRGAHGRITILPSLPPAVKRS